MGEYRVKGTGQQDSGATQTQQFKMKDVAFFGTNSRGGLYRLSPNAREFEIMNATCATLKLDNRRMGGKESVSTMNTMGMMSIVQYGIWVGGIFTLGLKTPTRGHTCRLILWMENASVSMTRTSGM